MTLPDGDVRIWSISLDASAASVTAYGLTLAEDEANRARRFWVERDRRRFVVAHGALRGILATYLDLDPAHVRLTRDARHKPMLRHAESRLQFNLAHAADVALVAVSCGRAVGVDVEAVAAVEVDAVGARFFSEGERRALSSLRVEERERAFFRIWTLKEAYAKATGAGLCEAFDWFDTSTVSAARRWHLHGLRAPRGFAAALVVERPAAAPRVLAWRHPNG